MSVSTLPRETLSTILTSPDGKIRMRLGHSAEGQLAYDVSRCGRTIIGLSTLGLELGGQTCGTGVRIGRIDYQDLSETFEAGPCRTAQETLCAACTVSIEPESSGPSFFLDVRAYNGGFALRYRVPGEGVRRLTREYSAWSLPGDSTLWISEPIESAEPHSLGWWRAVSSSQRAVPGWMHGSVSSPVLIELSSGGFLLIHEAALCRFSGMRLQLPGGDRLQACFQESEGFDLTGTVVSPWRVTIVAETLDGLVNSPLLWSLSQPPDLELFGDRRFIRPGKAAWRWWTKGTGSLEEQLQCLDQGKSAGCDYLLLDAGWERWSDRWQTVADLARACKSRRMGLFISKSLDSVDDLEASETALREFLDAASKAGAAGVRISGIPSSCKRGVAFQAAVLAETAKRRLMVILDGDVKATGESRTWPHEMSRGGFPGLRWNKTGHGPLGAAYNTVLPFTRFAGTPGDYSPLGLDRPGDTTWAHQLALAILLHSPLQVLAEDPDTLLMDSEAQPILDLLKALPVCWGETRVLPPSRVGAVAAMARRAESGWFVAAINGTDDNVQFDLDLSFLGSQTWRGVIYSSPRKRAFERRSLAKVLSSSRVTVGMKRVDGWVGWFRRRI